MKKDDLLSYHYEQMDIVKRNKDFLVTQGYVKSYRDVYPDVYDRIKDKKGVAYIRGRVSLKIMAILYDTVIVYIPPFPQNNWLNGSA